MALNASGRRRWLGALVLAGALALMLLGDPLLRHSPSPWITLGYWLLCLMLTLAAVAIALIDLLAVRRQTRQQERQLLEQTLNEIQAQAHRHRPRTLNSRNSPPK